MARWISETFNRFGERYTRDTLYNRESIDTYLNNLENKNLILDKYFIPTGNGFVAILKIKEKEKYK